MSVRIKDIAEEAGVSPATVSLVLNNKPGVGRETRDRIQEIVKTMEYRGPMSRQSQNTSAGSICFLHIARHGHAVNRDHDVFIADYIEGMSREAKEENLSLKIATFKSTPIEKIVENVKESNSRGFIVLGTELNFRDAEAFSVIDRPLVFIDTYYKYLNFDFVDMNNDDSVNKIIQCFIRNGHSRIGMVTSSQSTPNFKLREEAFRSSLSHNNLTYRKEDVLATDSTFPGAYGDMIEILNSGRDLPSALFCANDIIACGCLKALTEKGYRIPEDISVIGFDNLPSSSMSTPGLTTIDVCKVRMGRMAVQLLTDRIHSGDPIPPAKVLIGGKLIERDSVKSLQ